MQLTYEVLQRRIVRIGVQEGLKISHEIQSALECLRHPSSYTKSELQTATKSVKDGDEFDNFVTEAYNIIRNYESPMADYWLSYMEMIEILTMNIYSLKTQNWNMFKDSLRLMIPSLDANL